MQVKSINEELDREYIILKTQEKCITCS